MESLASYSCSPKVSLISLKIGIFLNIISFNSSKWSEKSNSMAPSISIILSKHLFYFIS